RCGESAGGVVRVAIAGAGCGERPARGAERTDATEGTPGRRDARIPTATADRRPREFPTGERRRQRVDGQLRGMGPGQDHFVSTGDVLGVSRRAIRLRGGTTPIPGAAAV